MSQKNYIKIYAQGKAVGSVRGDVFRKTIRGGLHMLRKPPAICFDLASLAQAERAGALRVDILDCETGTHYKTEIAIIREKGFAVRRGWGEQVGLPLHAFSRTGPMLHDIPAPASTIPEPQQPPRPAQLSFFGGKSHE